MDWEKIQAKHESSLTAVSLSRTHLKSTFKSLRPIPFLFRAWGHEALLIISGGSLFVVMLLYSMRLNLSLELRYFEPLTVSALNAYILLARALQKKLVSFAL